MQNILGIDISKDTFDVFLITEKRSHYKVFRNNPKGFRSLEKWLVVHQASQVHACMEATGHYGKGLTEFLFGQDHLVSVVNPARIKHYGDSKLHRNHNDKASADLIAEFCLKEKPSLWRPLSPEIKHLRALVRRFSDLKAARQQELNRLESGEKDKWVLSDLEAHVEYLDLRIRATKKEMKVFVAHTPKLKSQMALLTSIPGIAVQTGCVLLAEIGDFSTFENAPQVAAYAGLNPKNHRSGTSVFKKARISKQGRSELRCSLYWPAIVALRCNPVIQDLAERMKKTKHHKMEIIVAAMRKLLHLAYGVLKTQKPFDPNYGAQFNFSS